MRSIMVYIECEWAFALGRSERKTTERSKGMEWISFGGFESNGFSNFYVKK